MFKTEKHDTKKNNNLFTGLKVKKLRVSVNGEDYPEMSFNFNNGDVGEPYLAYTEACEYYGNECQLNINDFTKCHPVFCFNTTSQLENLTGNSVNITIEKEGTDQITTYCPMFEETHIIANLGDLTIKKL